MNFDIFYRCISVLRVLIVFFKSFLYFPSSLALVYTNLLGKCCLFSFCGNYSFLCYREPGAETKFKEISNAYEVKAWFYYASLTWWLL